VSRRIEQIPFYVVDVFTETPLAGNSLAVVADCEDLDDAAMKRVAREFNQSETTFVLPPTRAEAAWRLRCFTPTGFEAFGAGHNARGAWWWIVEAGRIPLENGRNQFHQELGDRILPVDVIASVGRPLQIVMTQKALQFGAILRDEAELAAALGLERTDLGPLSKQVVSTERRTCWCIFAIVRRSIVPSPTPHVSLPCSGRPAARGVISSASIH
jgi:PhzF family phenazine biosynthesis protein